MFFYVQRMPLQRPELIYFDGNRWRLPAEKYLDGKRWSGGSTYQRPGPILVIGTDGLNVRANENENWHTYRDIMVTHAFGSYIDVLKEVSYSPMMGDI